jgi:hypothetical protein
MLNVEHFQNTDCLIEKSRGAIPDRHSSNKENIGYWLVVVAHAREVQRAASEDSKSPMTALEYSNTVVVLNSRLENIATIEVALEDVAIGENMQVVS